MEKQLIRVIIFDLGNVLIDFDHSIAARRISRFCDKTPQEIFELFFSSGITTLFERGKISPDDFFLKVKEMLKLKINYDNFVHIWNEIFFLSAKNRAVFALANSLRANQRIIVLSNINILHFEYLKKYFPIFSIFERVFTSFELGAVKPDPEIYNKVMEILGVPAENIFYTDDRPELVASADNLGIRSVVFDTPVQLRRDLSRAGVNVS
ncbi:MAG: HAD family phosphatase [Candidatus Omnitrophica bacterium]|nr:HAD family phosphatase [Candidatus Omnitrophota bacterium]